MTFSRFFEKIIKKIQFVFLAICIKFLTVSVPRRFETLKNEQIGYAVFSFEERVQSFASKMTLIIENEKNPNSTFVQSF